MLDRDFLHAFKEANEITFDTTLSWLVHEYNKLIDIHKDRLPKRAVKNEYPQFLWFAPPFHTKAHDNILRANFTKSLKAIVGGNNNYMMLHLKKVWDENDRNLMKHGCFTEVVITKYWESLDSAFSFWCTHLAPQSGKVKQQQADKQSQSGLKAFIRHTPFSRFRWHSDDYRQRKSLPPPPPLHRTQHC